MPIEELMPVAVPKVMLLAIVDEWRGALRAGATLKGFLSVVPTDDPESFMVCAQYGYGEDPDREGMVLGEMREVAEEHLPVGD